MPETFDDPVLGRLTWNPTDRGWVGEPWKRSTTMIFVFFDRATDERKIALDQARGWCTRITQREAEYRTWTAIQLLELRSNTHQERSVSEVEEHLFLREVECHSDGAARLFWDDDDVLCDGDRISTWLDDDGGNPALQFD